MSDIEQRLKDAADALDSVADAYHDVSQTYQDSQLGVVTRVGAVHHYATTSAPDGWLECDGAAVSRTDYADLFAAIGTLWGVGDGSTTFNLPDVSSLAVNGGGPSLLAYIKY